MLPTSTPAANLDQGDRCQSRSTLLLAIRIVIARTAGCEFVTAPPSWCLMDREAISRAAVIREPHRGALRSDRHARRDGGLVIRAAARSSRAAPLAKADTSPPERACSNCRVVAYCREVVVLRASRGNPLAQLDDRRGGERVVAVSPGGVRHA
jgi:hypothetical protein